MYSWTDIKKFKDIPINFISFSTPLHNIFLVFTYFLKLIKYFNFSKAMWQDLQFIFRRKRNTPKITRHSRKKCLANKKVIQNYTKCRNCDKELNISLQWKRCIIKTELRNFIWIFFLYTQYSTIDLKICCWTMDHSIEENMEW